MMKRLLAFTALIACLAIPAEAQIVTGNTGSGGGGSGTVTSLTAAPGVTCSPNPVTGSGACGTTEALGNGGAPITGTTYAVNLSNSEPSDLAKELVFTGTSQLNATVGAGSAGMGFDIYNQSNTVAAIFTITGSVFYCHNGTCGTSTTLGLTSGQYANVFYDATISGWRATLFDEAGINSGTVSSGTTPNVALYAASGTTVSDGGGNTVGSIGGLNVVASGVGSVNNALVLCNTNTICLYSAGSPRVQCNATNCTYLNAIVNNTSGGFQLNNGAATSTGPTLTPNKAAATTGWGAQAAGNVSCVIVAVERCRFTNEGYVPIQATAPVPTGTGTPTIAAGSTDESGEVTAGTTATSVIITFNLTHTNAPFCVVTSQTQLVAFAYTISNTAITITQTATSGNKIDYRCSAH